MRICAAWLLKHVVATPSSPAIWHWKPSAFTSGRFSLTPTLRLLGRGFLVRMRSFTWDEPTPRTRRDAAKSALENAQRLEPNSPETLLALGYYQYRVLSDYGPAKTTFERVSKMLPNSSEVPLALGPHCPTRGALGSKRCLL